MYPELGVVPTLVEVKRTRAKRVGGPTRNPVGILQKARFAIHHVGSRCPRGPLLLAANGRVAFESQSLLADCNTEARRPTAVLNGIEEALRDIDNDRPRRFASGILDTLPPELRRRAWRRRERVC